ncbi:signal peptidase II [Brucepastera parasyntrophica]|uniref:signal peptidase II n=1 Tax=Brucepastera parasyntrophica TaxID=2880008 RepID=UPI00210C85BB|nr:signal peptidase II [Brucepastera parasyntrophica]ULQ58974.1 signal peptidase II [Brucepastera parasyntrophica]
MEKKLKERLLPFILTAGIILLDQLTKWIVTVTIPKWSVGPSFFGDFLRIIHVYNPGIAFSIGGGLSATVRSFLFGLMPLLVIAVMFVIYFRSNDLTKLQRWSIAGIIGGGLGNLIDRFFRPEGVVDFIDVKFYGLFGLERWPTFNVADASVVVCGILLLASLIFTIKKAKETAPEEKEGTDEK